MGSLNPNGGSAIREKYDTSTVESVDTNMRRVLATFLV